MQENHLQNPNIQNSKSQSLHKSGSAPQLSVNDKLPRVLAIANQKGGVGKTTTAVNLSTALAACDKKVLLIDLDGQGNASTGLGVSPSQRYGKSSYEVLIGLKTMSQVVEHTVIPNLDIVFASLDLSGAEIELASLARREYRLREAIKHQAQDYDYVLIDCPPALGFLTLNALVASDALFVPLQCEFYALEGLSHLIKTVSRVKETLNPKLEIQGIALTMYDKRNNLTEQVERDVRHHFGDKVYETVIPRNVRVSEAPSHGLPVIVYDTNCTGSQAYIHLAKEVVQREQNIIYGKSPVM